MKDMGNVHIPDNFQKGKIKKIPGPWGFESLSHQTRGFGYLPPLPPKKKNKKKETEKSLAQPWLYSLSKIRINCTPVMYTLAELSLTGEHKSFPQG